MQHLGCVCVVTLQSATVEKVVQKWLPELPEMKAEVVIVAILRFPIKSSFV